MASAVQKITLSPSQDIPFNKLVLSQSNVRQVKKGLSIEQLAESIAQKTLLQSLSVRAIVDADGNEAGMYEVPAGGRRFRALELLVKQKRMNKTQPVPCIVREGGMAEDDSLTENIERADLHPLDQFRAFQAMKDKGLDDEEIAARQFVSVNVVKQRLKLAAVSPKLLDLYAEDAMSYEQLMAFTVSHDHARQEQVWITISNGWNKQGYYIKRLLTEGAVNANDRRAVYVGLEAYEASGGIVTRDLFESDNGGWLQDPALLEKLVRDKLDAEAQAIQAEGWLWVETAIDFPYGHTSGLRELVGEVDPLSDDDAAARAVLQAEYDDLHEQYQGDFPDEVDERLGEIEELLEAFDDRPARYEPAEIARAGVFISLDAEGVSEIERGFVRFHDEPKVEARDDDDVDPAIDPETGEPRDPAFAPQSPDGEDAGPEAEDEDADDTLRPLSDRLKLELTSHRTLALRDAVANDPQAAYLTVLHVLVLSLFYPSRTSESCLEVSLRHTTFVTQAPGLAESISAKAIDARRGAWKEELPPNAEDVWPFLLALDTDSRQMLFAHCASLGINAQHSAWDRGSRVRNADQIAQLVGLDMVAAGWAPTVDNYLNRVPKLRILEAVREGRDERSAQLIDHLKKGDMAKEAERLLAGTGWLPEPLRTPGLEEVEAAGTASSDDDSVELPAFLEGNDAEPGSYPDADDDGHAIAAE
ncbi:MAG: DNA-binding protein [Pelagibacterium sp. SCN 63-23]|nr:MAG: DNA-binding protein [Pelagibacterium sp. SCN 63-23]